MTVRRVLAGVIAVLLGSGVFVGLTGHNAVRAVAAPSPDWNGLQRWCTGYVAANAYHSAANWPVVLREVDARSGQLVMVVQVPGYGPAVCEGDDKGYGGSAPRTPCHASPGVFPCYIVEDDEIITGSISTRVAALIVMFPDGKVTVATLAHDCFVIIVPPAVTDQVHNRIHVTALDSTGAILFNGPLG